MNRFVITFQSHKKDHPIITYGSRAVCTEWDVAAAKEKANWLNSLLDQAYEEGRQDVATDLYKGMGEEDD